MDLTGGKAGFATEGVLRRHYWQGGRLVDLEVVSVFGDHPLYAAGGPGTTPE
jgi:hypothetical protein